MNQNYCIPDKITAYLMRVPEILTEDEKADIANCYHNCGRDAFYEYGQKKKVLPYFAHSLAYIGCESDYWMNIHKKFMHRNQMVVELLDKVFTALDKNDVTRVCVTENFATILLSNACLGCFCSGDVDLLCMEEDAETIDRVMTSFGFIWSDRHARKKSFAREYRNEKIFETELGGKWNEFWLNFQFKPMTRKKTHLYDQRSILRRYPSLFDETVLYKNTHIRLFNAEALTYLNCIHISSGHYYILPPAFRLYADIDRIVRGAKVNWRTVKSWAEEDCIGLRINAVYQLVSVCLKTPIPGTAYTCDKGAMDFMNSLINIDNLELKVPKPGKINYMLFLIKTELRSDGTSTARALFRRLAALFSSE